MDLEEFLGQENINNFEKLLLVYLQFRSFKSYKDLEPVFKVSGVTIRKAIANLRKLGLLNNYDPVKLSFICKEIFTHENTECKENFTYKNDTCKENLTPCKEMFTSDSDRCKEKFTSCKENFTFSKNDPYIYNTNSININISSINKEEGKSSLTSFASTSLKYFNENLENVNDLDHKELNSVHNSLIPTKTEKASLAEIAKAPAKRTRAKAQFIPPTVEEVATYMKEVKAERIIKHPNLQFFNVEDQAENYMDHYGAEHHWHKGKELMKDWKAAARIWVRNFKGVGTYTTKRRKNQDAIEEIFGKGLEPETNIIDAVQTQNVDGSVLYDASSSNQITAQPAEEAELSAAEYIEKFKKGEIK